MRVHSLVELPILHSMYSESGPGVAPKTRFRWFQWFTHLPAKTGLSSVRCPLYQ